MLNPEVFVQIVAAVIAGEVILNSIKPVAKGLRKGIKAVAKKIAD